jgi:hypothetical protein
VATAERLLPIHEMVEAAVAASAVEQFRYPTALRPVVGSAVQR